MDNVWQSLKERFGEKSKLNVSFKDLTTLNIGGPVKALIITESEEELIDAIKLAKHYNLKYLVIGGGSNLLVSDEGFEGLVIKNNIQGISQNGSELEVRAGTILQDLVNYSIDKGLAGLNKLTGIPGTVGGAIYGNAGAYGQTLSDNLIEVTVINPVILSESEGSNIDSSAALQNDKQVITLTQYECQFNYRDSAFKKNNLIILSAKFKLTPADSETLKKESEEVLTKRLIKYPKGIKCPGSFFKNIVAETLPREILEKIPQEKIIHGKIPAGTLLEEVGAKGKSLDGIKIASYHANLFINEGSGTAKAFYDLAKEYYLKVQEKFGISLEPEVQLINLSPLS